jgi:hypothetical protein
MESVQIEIKKLEASKKKRSASQMSKEDDNEEGVVPSKKMKPTPADELDITAGPSCGDGGAFALQSGDGRSGRGSVVVVKQSGIQSNKAITTNASSLGENQGYMQLKAATEEANAFETQQEIDKAELEAKPGDEVSVSIKFGQQLGLSIKLDEGLDEVVIVEVLEACTFKDRVGIGWRIISFNDVPVTSVKDLVVKLGDAPRHMDRVIKFAKPSARIEAPTENEKRDAEKAPTESMTMTTKKMSSEASASSSVVEAGIDGSDSAAAKKRDEELMETLSKANRLGNWNRKKHNKLAELLVKRAFIAAAKDADIQKLSETSGGVTKAQVLEWMNGSETFKGLQQIILAKWSNFNRFMNIAMKDAGYKKISDGGSTKSMRYELPEDIVPPKH